MRVEYLMAHKRFQSTVIDGKTSAEIAGLNAMIINNILDFVRQELQTDMAQHGLHPDMIADSIRQRYEELQQSFSSTSGQTLGGGTTTTISAGDKRRLALESAERRAREQQQQQPQQQQQHEEQPQHQQQQQQEKEGDRDTN